MFTTLNAIKQHGPCVSGWRKLLNTLGKSSTADEPLSFSTILDSNGLEDALWCLRTLGGHQQEKRLYAVWCARQVLEATPDISRALDLIEQHALGHLSKEEFKAIEDIRRFYDKPSDISFVVLSTTKDNATAAAISTSAAARILVIQKGTTQEERQELYDKELQKQAAEFRRVFG